MIRDQLLFKYAFRFPPILLSSSVLFDKQLNSRAVFCDGLFFLAASRIVCVHQVHNRALTFAPKNHIPTLFIDINI